MANIQSIHREAARLRTEDVLAHLRSHGTARQVQCFELLSAWAGPAERVGLAQDAHVENGKVQQIGSLAVLMPCSIVTQWGSEHPLNLFLPILGSQQAELCAEAIRYCQTQKVLGILSLAHQALNSEFLAAWEYVITVSFPVAETALWILPLEDAELQRYGGEVELPRELAWLWDL